MEAHSPSGARGPPPRSPGPQHPRNPCSPKRRAPHPKDPPKPAQAARRRRRSRGNQRRKGRPTARKRQRTTASAPGQKARQPGPSARGQASAARPGANGKGAAQGSRTTPMNRRGGGGKRETAGPTPRGGARAGGQPRSRTGQPPPGWETRAETYGNAIAPTAKDWQRGTAEGRTPQRQQDVSGATGIQGTGHREVEVPAGKLWKSRRSQARQWTRAPRGGRERKERNPWHNTGARGSAQVRSSVPDSMTNINCRAAQMSPLHSPVTPPNSVDRGIGAKRPETNRRSKN